MGSKHGHSSEPLPHGQFNFTCITWKQVGYQQLWKLTTEVIQCKYIYIEFYVLLTVHLGVKQSHYRPEVPRGFQEVKFSQIT